MPTTMPRQAWLAQLPAAFTWAEAQGLGLSNYALQQLRDANLIEQLARGLYCRTDLPPGDYDLTAAALRAPRATLCLRSALARHDLIDDIPGQIDLALPRSTRPPHLDAPISWHRFDPATFDLGRETIELGHRVIIGLYSPERSILDAFRLRRLEGPELGNEALRRWLGRRGAHPSTLLRLAAQFPRTEAPLRRSLEVLL
ncbi:hypothetical protein acdb102_49180 [Acidothermaceae bacterium B102]|nr:hypothetical protein acdb102_49180 [Acidothermaceae bacterium B102]